MYILKNIFLFFIDILFKWALIVSKVVRPMGFILVEKVLHNLLFKMIKKYRKFYFKYQNLEFVNEFQFSMYKNIHYIIVKKL